jgi:hypothetical protein
VSQPTRRLQTQLQLTEWFHTPAAIYRCCGLDRASTAAKWGIVNDCRRQRHLFISTTFSADDDDDDGDFRRQWRHGYDEPLLTTTTAKCVLGTYLYANSLRKCIVVQRCFCVHVNLASLLTQGTSSLPPAWTLAYCTALPLATDLTSLICLFPAGLRLV